MRSTAGRLATLARDPDTQISNKVPEITAWFWAAKILTTAMGETLSDALVHQLGPGIAIPLGGVAFGLAMLWQLTTPTYRAGVYWLAVAMVGVFGTMAADVLHVGLHIPYIVSTGCFAIALVGVFTLWQRHEHTLSIHSITTPRRELFYWSAVLSTFALGTAAGDLTAHSLGIGYFWSAVLFGAVILVPAVALWRGANAVAMFWFAYVVTRPFGASVSDWLAAPRHSGGINMGYGVVSVILTAAIVAIVAYLYRTQLDIQTS